jgi:hypothetical protein
MAGIVFDLRGLTDHIGTQLDDLVGALKKGDSAEVTRLFDNTIHPYLTDLDDLTQTQLENTMSKVLFSASATNLEKARSLVAIFTFYVRSHVPGRHYWCPINLDSPRAATATAAPTVASQEEKAPQAVPLYVDEPDVQPLQEVPKMEAVNEFEPILHMTEEEKKKVLDETLAIWAMHYS